MDTRLVQDPEEFASFGHLTFLEPDNIYMGSTVAMTFFKAMVARARLSTPRTLSTRALRSEPKVPSDARNYPTSSRRRDPG
jgi:hypothetical protein